MKKIFSLILLCLIMLSLKVMAEDKPTSEPAAPSAPTSQKAPEAETSPAKQAAPTKQAAPAKQGILNKLLAPGPLIEGHKNLEKVDCLKCHDAGHGVPNSLCLDCHKDIKKSIERKNTFHGLSSNKNCIECHLDHQGRDFSSTIVPTDKSFNHDLTGHILKGKHKDIKCADCHKEKREKMAIRKDDIHFLGTATSCKSCHQKHDVHLYKDDYAKKDCDACHNESKWKDVPNFKHDKVSNYKLIGKHAEMSCARCHTPAGDKVGPSIYKWPNLEKDGCISCHKVFHKDTMSEKFSDGKCDRCHDMNSWKIKKFEHKITNFILKGKHAETTCVKCHKETTAPVEVSYNLVRGTAKLLNHKYSGLQTACVTCHKDIHQFGPLLISTRFGKLENCQSCHNERKFKEGVNFNHNLDTRFKIDGKHKPLTCIKCHLNTIPENKDSDRIYQFKDLEKDNCIICHKSPHLKTFSPRNIAKRCSTCHVTSSWKETRTSELFNHNLDTNFPLDGKHVKLDCKSCHKEGDNKIFKFNFREKQFCEACHENVHKNQFTENFSNKSCLECHNTEIFKDMKKFDHNKTTFQLNGKHSDPKVQCVDCHKPTKENLEYRGKVLKFKSNFKFVDDKKGLCETCHINVHNIQFSKSTQNKACTTCHTTDNFHQRKTFDHGITAFPLLGLHEKVDCTKCHKPTGERFSFEQSKAQSPKHQFLYVNLDQNNCKTCHIDHHKGEYGNSCKDCHSEHKKWKSTENFHKDFLLTGVHYTLKCNECHKNQRRLNGMSDSCQMCHQKDDHHHGSLPNCKECHRQEFWEVTTFKHSRTTFPLRGIHRTISCDSCHSSGIYQGKSSDCISCHYTDKLKAKSLSGIDHSIAGFETCSQCHNQFIFHK